MNTPEIDNSSDCSTELISSILFDYFPGIDIVSLLITEKIFISMGLLK